MTTHVLFDSGAARSFVSLTLGKKFSDAPQILDYPLVVDSANDLLMSDLRVHQGFVMNLFSERYSIDFVLIPLPGSKVIIGMDLLGPNGAMIELKHHLVKVQIPSGSELIILSEGA